MERNCILKRSTICNTTSLIFIVLTIAANLNNFISCLCNMTSFAPTSWRDYSLCLYVRCKIVSSALLNYSDLFVTSTLLIPLITYLENMWYMLKYYKLCTKKSLLCFQFAREAAIIVWKPKQ